MTAPLTPRQRWAVRRKRLTRPGDDLARLLREAVQKRLDKALEADSDDDVDGDVDGVSACTNPRHGVGRTGYEKGNLRPTTGAAFGLGVVHEKEATAAIYLHKV